MAALTPLTLDFETFYSAKINLKTLGYSQYIPQAQPYLAGICYSDRSRTIEGFDALQRELALIDWSTVQLVSHNTLFDAAVLKHWFGHTAAQYACTLSASRYWRPHAKHDLESLRAHYLPDMPRKTGEVLVNAKNKTWDELAATEQRALAAYAVNDAELCKALFELLYNRLPAREIALIDMTVKLWLNHSLKFDTALAAQHLDAETKELEQRIEALNLDPATLRSSPKFASLLDSMGYTPPQKWSAKQQKYLPALASADPELANFKEDNHELTELLEVKADANSNILKTRTERIIDTVSRTDGILPVCYNYYGAATGRFSGSNKINLQNLTRGGILRRCIMAPDEKRTILVADLAQIEARLLAWFAGQDTLLAIFREKGDPYLELARRIYNDPTLTKKNNPAERQAGKVATLGLGYSMSAPKFQIFARIQNLKFDLDFCETVVQLYRTTYPRIRRCWNILNDHIHCLQPESNSRYDGDALPKEVRTPFGVAQGLDQRLMPGFTMRAGAIDLPSGRSLFYENVTRWNDEWVYANNKKLYGGKLTENIIQALARDVMCDAMLAINARYPVVMHTHDELVMLIDKRDLDEASTFVRRVMTTPPTWAPSLPLDVDIGHGHRYGDAK